MFFGKIWGSSSEKILLKSLKTYDLIHSEKVVKKQEKHGLINVEALKIIKIWKKEKKCRCMVWNYTAKHKIKRPQNSKIIKL